MHSSLKHLFPQIYVKKTVILTWLWVGFLMVINSEYIANFHKHAHFPEIIMYDFLL